MDAAAMMEALVAVEDLEEVTVVVAAAVEEEEEAVEVGARYLSTTFVTTRLSHFHGRVVLILNSFLTMWVGKI